MAKHNESDADARPSVTLTAEQFDALLARQAPTAATSSLPVVLQIPSETTEAAFARKLREKGQEPSVNVERRFVRYPCVSVETGVPFTAVVVESRADPRGRVLQIEDYERDFFDEQGFRNAAGMADILKRIALWEYGGTDGNPERTGATKRSAYLMGPAVPLDDPSADKRVLTREFIQAAWRERYQADLKRYGGALVSKCGLMLASGERPPTFPALDAAAE